MCVLLETIETGMVSGKADLCGKRIVSKAAILLLARAPLSHISANATFTFSCFAVLGFLFHPLPNSHHGEARC